MNVSLEFITPNAEETIGRFAAICYDGNTEHDACIKRASSCVDRGHLSTLRFAHAVFTVRDISRACSHQLVRHKHLDYLQQSQRYVNQEEASFIYPGTSEDYLISSAYQSALATYHQLLAKGIKKEDARMVLPTGISTSMHIVGNLQAWLDFINLRTDKSAQREIRKVAIEVNNQLAKECPNIFKEIVE